MRTRPIMALLAALALLAVMPFVALAQGDSSAEPPDGASPEVEEVYDDYADDGRIDVCDHERDVLQDTLDTIEEDVDRDFPDFRAAVRAGIQRHDRGRCGEDADPTPTPTVDPGTTAPDPTPEPTFESGDLPDPDTSTSSDDGAIAPPPDDGSLPPVDDPHADPHAEPEAGAVPPPPVPTVAPAVPAGTPTPSPTPIVVTSSRSDELLIPGILIGVALLGAAALLITGLGAYRSPRWQAAWNEAGFRVRSTWEDFSDWLRTGR